MCFYLFSVTTAIDETEPRQMNFRFDANKLYSWAMKSNNEQEMEERMDRVLQSTAFGNLNLNNQG